VREWLKCSTVLYIFELLDLSTAFDLQQSIQKINYLPECHLLCDLLQLQRAQLHAAILSRDKITRQNRAIKSQA